MRTIQMMSILALGLWFATPAAAAPWCAYDSRGGVNCGFQSYEQCRRNIMGLGGTCQRNLEEPEGAAAPAQPTKRARRNQPREATKTAPAADWCTYDSRGGVNCGFRSFEQCQRNLAGVGGSCQRNLQR